MFCDCVSRFCEGDGVALWRQMRGALRVQMHHRRIADVVWRLVIAETAWMNSSQQAMALQSGRAVHRPLEGQDRFALVMSEFKAARAEI